MDLRQQRRGPLRAPRVPGFYLLGGALAGLTQVAIDPTSTIPTIGASGAIAATLGAYFVLFPRARVTSLVFLGFFYQLIDVPAIIVLGFWFVLQLIDGLTSLGVIETGGGVAFFAHIGGFVVGAVMAKVIVTVCRPPARAVGSVRLGSRGIIAPWTTDWSRWSSRASGSTCSPAATW